MGWGLLGLFGVEGLDMQIYGEIRGKKTSEWEGIAAAETQVSESRPGAPDFVTQFRPWPPASYQL
jgi:hypothetical protein